jgi:hypothetical protein
MATSKHTVIYDSGTNRHKLLKIMLSDDGSYYATCPYHPSDRVRVWKATINYANLARRQGDDPIELAVVEDDKHRLKLSHHPDGFVQFSGYNIRSGRNADGSPKGIGLVSFPLHRPTAGPAFGLTVQNPAAFKLADAERDSDIIFKRNELFMAEQDNGLIIETYYFRPEWRRFIKLHHGHPIIILRHPSGALLELRVCTPPANNWSTGFMGIDLWPAPIKFGVAESGFAMSSPTGSLRQNEDGELEGDALFAVYPPPTSDFNQTLMLTAFPPRDDPPYRDGEPGPTEDSMTQAVRAVRRYSSGADRAQAEPPLDLPGGSKEY